MLFLRFIQLWPTPVNKFCEIILLEPSLFLLLFSFFELLLQCRFACLLRVLLLLHKLGEHLCLFLNLLLLLAHKFLLLLKLHGLGNSFVLQRCFFHVRVLAFTFKQYGLFSGVSVAQLTVVVQVWLQLNHFLSFLSTNTSTSYSTRVKSIMVETWIVIYWSVCRCSRARHNGSLMHPAGAHIVGVVLRLSRMTIFLHTHFASRRLLTNVFKRLDNALEASLLISFLLVI